MRIREDQYHGEDDGYEETVRDFIILINML